MLTLAFGAILSAHAAPPATEIRARQRPIAERWDDAFTSRLPRGAHARFTLENWNNQGLDADTQVGFGTNPLRGLVVGATADLGLGWADPGRRGPVALTPLRVGRVVGWLGTLGNRWSHALGFGVGGTPSVQPYRFRFLPQETAAHWQAHYLAQARVGQAQVSWDLAVGHGRMGGWFSTIAGSVVGPVSNKTALSMAMHHSTLPRHRFTVGVHVRPNTGVELGIHGGMMLWLDEVHVIPGPLALASLKVWTGTRGERD